LKARKRAAAAVRIGSEVDDSEMKGLEMAKTLVQWIHDWWNVSADK
jgi:hypothetical protein